MVKQRDILMIIGGLIMIAGALTLPLPPFASVGAGPVTISDIPPFSAALIGVGAIIFLAGVFSKQ